MPFCPDMSAVLCYQMVRIFQYFQRISFAVFGVIHYQHLLSLHNMFALVVEILCHWYNRLLL